MITAQLQGRRLALTVETEEGEPAIAPFLVDPLPARVGRELSINYLFAIEGIPLGDGDMGRDIIRAFGQHNAERADEELHQAEAEIMMWAAFMWQTIGGIEAARAILEVDDGVQGTDRARGKALALFRLRSAPLLSQIRHRLESARLTLQGDTPATDSRPGGARSDEHSSDSLSSEPPATPSEPSNPSSPPASPSPPTAD